MFRDPGAQKAVMLLEVCVTLCDGSVFLMPSEVPEISNFPCAGGDATQLPRGVRRRPPTLEGRPVVLGSRRDGPCRCGGRCDGAPV